MAKFIGGIHPPYNKFTKKDKIEVAPLPKGVVLPLQQHIGAPCLPLVKEGDKVKVGQKIAEAGGFVSAPIHASISGIVVGMAKANHPVLGECSSIIIESDGRIEWHDSVKSRDNVDSLSKDELKNMIKEAGIVGLGGAAFPTHVKLSPPKDKQIDIVILNGAECEPYLTCDHSLMLDEPDKIIKGFQLIIKILEPNEAYIGIEDNKQNAISLFEEKIQDLGLQSKIKVVTLSTIYPQGAEKNLIYTITGRKVPNAGGLPMDVGVVVQNVGTAKAIYDAVYEGKPLVERVVTITGAVKKPKNLLVKIGTTVKDLINFCEGVQGSAGKIISGGPMMGIAQSTDEIPIIKGSSGVLVQIQEDLSKEEEKDCIRCGRCVDACPMLLLPTTISQYSQKNDLDKCDEYFATDCFECGCCSYVCPSKIPLVHWIKYAKGELMKRKKK